MLNRWLRFTTGDAATDRRPGLASSVTNIADAERWRRQILREIATSITSIQNGALGEPRIRDLNDQINKLLREKYHWERQIRQLGGRDYSSTGARITDTDGKVIRGDGGYLYFGAARELPGVKAMVAKREAEASEHRQRHARHRDQLMKKVDVVYFGWVNNRDTEEQLAEERAAEKAGRTCGVNV